VTVGGEVVERAVVRVRQRPAHRFVELAVGVHLGAGPCGSPRRHLAGAAGEELIPNWSHP
jgi:hypothetical protein